MVDPLDKILKRRAEPQARSHLAAHIIEASQASGVRHNKKPSFFAFLKTVFTESFLMPKPALVMSAVMVLGLYVGFMFEGAASAEVDLAVLYIEDSIELGDWL